MKIVQETQAILVLKQKNYVGIFIGILLFAIGVCLLISQGVKDIKMLVISIIFILISLLVVVSTKFITLIIDKTSKRITITSKGLMRHSSQNIAIDQVKEVAIEESVTLVRTNNSSTTNSGTFNLSSSNPGMRKQVNYVLIFYLKDGQGIPVQIDSPASFSVGGLPIGDYLVRNKIIELGNKIANFIAVPFKDNRPPTVNEVITGVVNTVKNSQANLEIPTTALNKPTTTQ